MTGIRGFKYKVSQEKEPIYAEGNTPAGMGRGNKKYDCELKCVQSALEAIILSAGGDPTDVAPFTIVHTYQPKKGLPIITDVVEEFEFTDIEKAMDQGAKFMEVTLPGVCTKIKFNTLVIPQQ